MTSTRRYGWLPDLPDPRDHLAAVPMPTAPLPPSVDLYPILPPVFDQQNLGSCTANAACCVLEAALKQASRPVVDLSRLFLYYVERRDIHRTQEDSGASIRESAKAMAKVGVPPEADWPYNVLRFAQRPPAVCFAEAKNERITSYARMPRSLAAMRAYLATVGLPFLIGISVFDSFESDQVAKSGQVPMPGPGEKLLGGHAVAVIGYDDAAQRFRCRNSWGASWGMAGDFTLPFSYLMRSDLSGDFWTISL